MTVSELQAEGFITKSNKTFKSTEEDLHILRAYLKNLIEWLGDNNKNILWRGQYIIPEIKEVNKKIKELEVWYQESQSQNTSI